LLSELYKGHFLSSRQFSQKFLRKDAKKQMVIRVDKLIRKATIYAKITFCNYTITNKP